MKPQDTVENVGKLLANHKLMPCLGAGVSIRYLSEWHELTKKIAAEAKIEYTDDIITCKEFLQTKGRDSL